MDGDRNSNFENVNKNNYEETLNYYQDKLLVQFENLGWVRAKKFFVKSVILIILKISINVYNECCTGITERKIQIYLGSKMS